MKIIGRAGPLEKGGRVSRVIIGELASDEGKTVSADEYARFWRRRLSIRQFPSGRRNFVRAVLNEELGKYVFVDGKTSVEGNRLADLPVIERDAAGSAVKRGEREAQGEERKQSVEPDQGSR